MSERLVFKVIGQDSWSGARAGVLSTRHAAVETPIFMPVATQAVLRAVDVTVTEELGYQILLANTYHLLLRVGPERMKRFGGIHKFMNWPRAVLTDSGGFQIFSLSDHLTMSEQGALFRSYIDGSSVLLTPESSIAMQEAIGSDIMMVLDQCIDSTSDEPTTRAALELTTRWAKRSLAARTETGGALFGIVQGACFPHLRQESADQICSLPFDGFALGGLAVGETKSEREDMIECSAPLLPATKPRYLMGVGTPIDLLEAVKRNMDMFDCILPTSLAGQGVCFTPNGKVDLRRGIYRDSHEPVQADCSCSTCRRFTRGYLHHLVQAREFVAGQLLSVHNLTFYQRLMRDMRTHIIAGSFKGFYEQQRQLLGGHDQENPPNPPKRRSAPSLSRGDYEIVPHIDGYGSIRQRSSGETMHSVSDPVEEAQALYIEQSGLVELAQHAGEPLVVWDVGLGAATNAMVAIMALEKCETIAREIHIISFERDLDPLTLALTRPSLFRHLRHPAPHTLLEQRDWRNSKGTIRWSLRTGEYPDTAREAPAPEIIWYDPFSYKVDTALWHADAFEQLLASCEKKPARLFTYTASTAVRGAMLHAGWFVGAGRGSGPKAETTLAYAPSALKHFPQASLLDQQWLARWERSDARQPLGETSSESLTRIREHAQFRGKLTNPGN